MKNTEKIKLFLVDDDAVSSKMLEIELMHSADFEIERYATGELCVANLANYPDVIILDYNLNGIDKNAMDGLMTLDKIKAFNSDIPVVMLSAQDEIEVAVDCMHHRAYDYVVKNKSAFPRLQKIMTSIFSYWRMEKDLTWYA
jgi:two-component system, OmpR family, response regulator